MSMIRYAYNNDGIYQWGLESDGNHCDSLLLDLYMIFILRRLSQQRDQAVWF